MKRTDSATNTQTAFELFSASSVAYVERSTFDVRPVRLRHENPLVRPVGFDDAVLHVDHGHVVVLDANGSKQADGGNFLDRILAVVLVQRRNDLALETFHDLGV